MNHRPEWGPGEGWTVNAEPEFVIGGLNGLPGAMRDSLHLMWEVTSAAPLADGRVVMLAPTGDRKVLVFERSGRFSASFGREGRGPGEMTYPMHLEVLPGDTIKVWDYMFGSVNFFDPAGDLLRERRVDLGAVIAAVREPGTTPGESMYRPLPDGSFLLEVRRSDWQLPTESDQVYRYPTSYVRIDSSYTAHSFGWWEGKEQLSLRGSIVPEPLPFPANSIARGGGDPLSVFVTNGDSYEIRQFSATGILRRILRRDSDRIRLSDHEFDLWKENALAGGNPLTNWVRWERSVAALPPRHHAAIRNMRVDSSGHLWIQDTAEWEEGTSRWSVFDPAGRWLGSLEIPSLGIYWVGEDLILGGDVDYDTGVRTVTGYRLDRRAG